MNVKFCIEKEHTKPKKYDVLTEMNLEFRPNVDDRIVSDGKVYQVKSVYIQASSLLAIVYETRGAMQIFEG